MDIIAKFENEISSVLSGFPAGTIFLAAVSGGADSMAMLTALCSLFLAPDSRFSVLHVEHGLRPEEESGGDAEFVSAFCKERGIVCRVRRIPPGRIAAYAKRKGIGIEAAARFFRHKALRAEVSLLKQRAMLGEHADIRVLTAHTKDDLLETALMRVLRGCGPAGLAAMAESKEQLTEDKAKIVRPLMALSRADVIAYLKAKGISWREDATNADERFLRNRIRRRLVPLLDEAFPSWKAGVAAMAQTQALTADFLADEARRLIVWECNNTRTSRKDAEAQSIAKISFLSTDEKNFFMQPLIVREEAVFQAIDMLLRKAKNPRSIKRAVVRRFCERETSLQNAQAAVEDGVKAADFGTVTARREGGNILLARKRKEFFECGISALVR